MHGFDKPETSRILKASTSNFLATQIMLSIGQYMFVDEVVSTRISAMTVDDAFSMV